MPCGEINERFPLRSAHTTAAALAVPLRGLDEGWGEVDEGLRGKLLRGQRGWLFFAALFAALANGAGTGWAV